LLLRACCKNLVQVAPAIQHAYNFRGFIVHAIKDDMGTRRNRSKPKTNFITGSTGEWMVFK
jgi:hypothetical protein